MLSKKIEDEGEKFVVLVVSTSPINTEHIENNDPDVVIIKHRVELKSAMGGFFAKPICESKKNTFVGNGRNVLLALISLLEKTISLEIKSPAKRSKAS